MRGAGKPGRPGAQQDGHVPGPVRAQHATFRGRIQSGRHFRTPRYLRRTITRIVVLRALVGLRPRTNLGGGGMRRVMLTLLLGGVLGVAPVAAQETEAAVPPAS